MTSSASLLRVVALGAALITPAAGLPQVAVRGHIVHTMAGPPIYDGMVIIRDGKIAAVGKAADVHAPPGFQVLEAAIVTPGLIDAHTVVGLAGYLNYAHDQDQLEASSPIQPELRAVDAYNARDALVEWLRGFGITSIHTGHGPGGLISGQTMVVKTKDGPVDEAIVKAPAAIAVTLGPASRRGESRSPGTRGKMMAMLREKLIQAGEYGKKAAREDREKRPARDLALETLVRVLEGDLPLLITAQKAQDIASALRLAEEFKLKVILDGAAEAPLVIDRIRAAGFPVILHPPMARASGEMESASYESAALLRRAGIPFALQSGYESYVPKTRVVLFEAAIAAANGLSFEEALASITIDAARILRVAERVGSIEVGKDGDLALYDGDPFEYTTHCTGVVIEGKVVSNAPR
ncbi:MAG TPA: amidohydrolase family protein [Planctomycetota bacterium]|nr:amidohydrolase family protein [Planctomycetota bacterium]